MELYGWNRTQKRINDIIRMVNGGNSPIQSKNIGNTKNISNNKISNVVESTKKSGLNLQKIPSNYNSGSFAQRLDKLIDREAALQKVSPKLVRALVQVESGGLPHARSPKGALGLMQLMPKTAQQLGVNPLDPQQNLSGGIRYLKSMANRFRDLDLALAAYNAGPGAVEKYGGVPPYKETQQYIRKVRGKL